MLVGTISTSPSVGVPIAFGSTHYSTAIQNVGRVKSFVDDLIMKRGTVSMRVALVLRSAEVQPLLRDLCKLLKACQFFPPTNPRLLQEEEAPMTFDSPRVAIPFPCEFLASSSAACKKHAAEGSAKLGLRALRSRLIKELWAANVLLPLRRKAARSRLGVFIAC